MWTKSHFAIWKTFPEVNKSEYYKRVQMFGLQPFWNITWFDRFVTTSSFGEASPEINACWATLMLYHLDQLWPQLDNISDDSLARLTIINRCTNRFKGAKSQGLAIATKCVDPNRLEGFIDLFEDVATNEEMLRWVTKQFLPKKTGVK